MDHVVSASPSLADIAILIAICFVICTVIGTLMLGLPVWRGRHAKPSPEIQSAIDLFDRAGLDRCTLGPQNFAEAMEHLGTGTTRLRHPDVSVVSFDWDRRVIGPMMPMHDLVWLRGRHDRIVRPLYGADRKAVISLFDRVRKAMTAKTDAAFAEDIARAGKLSVVKGGRDAG